MSLGPWRVEFAHSAEKDIDRLDTQVRRRVIVAIRQVAEDPWSGKLRKLQGREGARLRVGDWRVIVALDASTRTIRVKRVLPRGRAYDR